MALIGLDVGTSGCKCTIFDLDGKIRAAAHKEYGTVKPGPGLFELDPGTVWESVKYVIGSAVSRYQGDKITALCISSFGESAVPVDKDGKILHNSLLYTDLRGDEQTERLQQKLGLEEIMKLTGIPAHPMYTIGKVMWFKENLPEIYKKTWKFLLYEDFILLKLGGVPAIDYSLASRTMAFNVTEKTWAKEILDAAGVEDDIFSPVVPSGTVVANIKKSVADELGLPSNLLLVTGGHDQACAAMGAGIIREGLAVDGMGSTECITPAFARPVINAEMLNYKFACVPHAVKGMYITYAFSFTGGALLKWYRDNFAGHERLEAEARGISVYSLLDAKAAVRPTGILVLPHFAGAGTPYMDTAAQGAIVGLNLDVTAGELYRAMLEGVTYEMLYNIDSLASAGVEIRELRAVGGGAKSDLWLQLKADIMGRKVATVSVNEAGTTGTAILAGIATGVYGSVEEAVERLVKVEKEFYPDERNHRIYAEYYQKYKRMYQAVKEILK